MNSCTICRDTGQPWQVKAGREIRRCPSCALLWVPDGLARTAEGLSVYEGESPVFLADGNDQYYLDDSNLRSAEVKARWVREYLPEGTSLLDIGANFGHFLKAIGSGFRAQGVELSTVAVKWSRERFQVDNQVGSIYELSPELESRFDAVTLWDVIEHVPDARGALTAAARVLRLGGLLFLSTPDADSIVARTLGRHWHYVDPVQHIALFGRRNLGRLLQEEGFEVVASRTFGHFYRLGYVFERLRYLHRESTVRRAVLAGAALVARPLAGAQLYLNLRDVMGMVARRVR